MREQVMLQQSMLMERGSRAEQEALQGTIYMLLMADMADMADADVIQLNLTCDSFLAFG